MASVLLMNHLEKELRKVLRWKWANLLKLLTGLLKKYKTMPYCECGAFSRDVINGGPCASCERQGRKDIESERKYQEKRQTALSVPGKKRQAAKRQTDHNTFLCSDGTRVTQSQIDHNRSVAYKLKYPVQEATCHGCW